MAVGYPVIEMDNCSVFFYICMAVRYPIIDRWRVIQSFLYMYGCWISSDRKMEC